MNKNMVATVTRVLVSASIGIACILYQGVMLKLWSSIVPHGIILAAILIALYNAKASANASATNSAEINQLMATSEAIRTHTIPQLNTAWLQMIIILVATLLFVIFHNDLKEIGSWTKYLVGLMAFLEFHIASKTAHLYFVTQIDLNIINGKIEVEKTKQDQRQRTIEELRKDKDNHDFDNDQHLKSYLTPHQS